MSQTALRTAALVALVFGAPVLTACGGGRERAASARGHAGLAGAHSSARIVTLAPSLTEIAYAVGCGHKLVADTTYDDYPQGARSLPHVADLVSVDLERLSALRPTAVIALHDQEREASPIQTRLHVDVAYLPNRNLADLFTDIARVGEICGTSRASEQLSRSLRARISAVAAKARRYPLHPKVLFLLDLPGFTAGSGSFLDDLIRLAGGINVAGDIRQAYPNISAEALLAMDPHVIVVAREVQFGPDVQTSQPWRSIQAVRAGRVVRPPSDDIIERNGPRIVEGLEWLVSAIHSGR